MRNVIFAINVTLDSCCDHTKMIGDDEIHECFTHLMRDVDLLVFGRKTYQLTSSGSSGVRGIRFRPEHPQRSET